jgi:hypothetical protein
MLKWVEETAHGSRCASPLGPSVEVPDLEAPTQLPGVSAQIS